MEKNIVNMVDTGATQTFMSSKIVKEYQLKVTNCPTKMKAINSTAQPSYNMALNVPLMIGHWFGVHNLTVVSLDDFNLLLGIDFMKKIKTAPIPHLYGLMFMGEKDSGFIKGIRPFAKGTNKTAGLAALLSATAFEKGLKKGECAYLATLIEVKLDVQVEVLYDVAKLLMEFKGVMPLELPRELPLRREIDHRIELIRGSMPLGLPL
ncbi:hypothetical protein KY290_017502 [Solanum tuberosum]|uniref:Peptidase A2 domain-containing protein n=1 Tax=Solanum tuberosum TaxID=4113 RepID=A0ABQ7VBG3_SOLTU|nr:hypothetical protein KY290_017502 [Solanum tuberosum]